MYRLQLIVNNGQEILLIWTGTQVCAIVMNMLQQKRFRLPLLILQYWSPLPSTSDRRTKSGTSARWQWRKIQQHGVSGIGNGRHCFCLSTSATITVRQSLYRRGQCVQNSKCKPIGGKAVHIFRRIWIGCDAARCVQFECWKCCR